MVSIKDIVKSKQNEIDEFKNNLNAESARDYVMQHPEVYRKMNLSDNDVAEMGSEAIIALAITVFIVAVIIPVALTQLNTANTSGMDAGQLALYGLIGTVALLAIIIGLIKHVKS
jgi:hypothetical protein